MIKLITLNIWGGCIQAPLADFMMAHQDIDIFCLQEVYHRAPDKVSTDDRWVNLNFFDELQALLPQHVGFFRPVVKGIYGIGLFVKKSIDVLGEGEILIHENLDFTGMGPDHSRNLQWLECRSHGKIYSVLNVHGLWNGLGKTDVPARIAQSKRIKDFMDTLSTPKILCGDFNLRPDTQSLAILAEGMNHLIEKYHVSSTRTSFYPKEEKHADYIFTSPEIEVRRFEVLPDEVSDHAPLLLEFL